MTATVNQLETLWFEINCVKAHVRKLYDKCDPYPELDAVAELALKTAERTEIFAHKIWSNAKADLEDAPERIHP
jgi:hypothetical protein